MIKALGRLSPPHLETTPMPSGHGHSVFIRRNTQLLAIALCYIIYAGSFRL